MSHIPLEQTVLFRVLDEPRRERIRPQLRSRRFKEREYLYFDGQPADHLWTVRTGEVRTLKGHLNGRVTTLERLVPGDVFGMAAIAKGARFGESAQALVEGEAWYLPRRTLAAMLNTDPELGRALLEIVAGRLQAAHDRL